MKSGCTLDQAYEKAGFITFDIPKENKEEETMTPEQYEIMRKISWSLNPSIRPKQREKKK